MGHFSILENMLCMRTNTKKSLILSKNDIQCIVQHYGLNEVIDKIIARIDLAFKNYKSDKTIIPIRSGFHYDQPHTGLIEWMPLLQSGESVMMKIVGYHPSNPGVHALPTIVSTISTYDTKTGQLVGIMDGVLLTALRTGAASAVASKYLARPESSTLGLIGCGAQGITQVHALSRLFPLKKIMIYDTDPMALKTFATRCDPLDLEVEWRISEVKELVQEADILCTATSVEIGRGPLFEDQSTKPWLHINAVGSDFPGKIELPLRLLQRSLVIPDFKAQAVEEGECQSLSNDEIGPDLAELIQNQELYAQAWKKRSIFDSTGWALEDQVTMELFLECASELSLGQEIEIENLSADAKNPYDFLTKAVLVGD